MTTLSMDGTDPATWDPALDGVLAAPENHTVLYEDEAIRVISVSIAPGAIEKPHQPLFARHLRRRSAGQRTRL